MSTSTAVCRATKGLLRRLPVIGLLVVMAEAADGLDEYIAAQAEVFGVGS